MLPILKYRKSCMIFNKALHLCVYELHVSQVEGHKPQKSIVSQLLHRLIFQSQGAGSHAVPKALVVELLVPPPVVT